MLASGEEPEQQARQAASDFIEALQSEPEWNRLFFEFALYASRNEAFREQFVARMRAMRTRIAELLDRRAAELGIVLPLPVEQVAAMSFAMANGAGLEQLVDPESMPTEFYPAMVATFFNGLRAASEPAAGQLALLPVGEGTPARAACARSDSERIAHGAGGASTHRARRSARGAGRRCRSSSARRRTRRPPMRPRKPSSPTCRRARVGPAGPPMRKMPTRVRRRSRARRPESRTPGTYSSRCMR